MQKLIRLIKRAPGKTVEAFQSGWREQLPPLVAALPGLRRYVQSLALPQGYRKGELLFDGIDEWVFDSVSALNAARQSPAFRALQEQSAVLASSAVDMPVEVWVMLDGPIPTQGAKNIEFVKRRPGMPLEDFRRYWREVHGPLAARIPVLRRYEQNHLAIDAYADALEPEYDGLAITWFDSTAAMREGTASPEYLATRADEQNFLPDGHLPIIITRERVVFER